MYLFILDGINKYMSHYSKRFTKILERDEEEYLDDELDAGLEMSDAEALDGELTDITGDDLGASELPEGSDGSPISSQQKAMYDELSSWVEKMDEFAQFLNGTSDSMQTTLNSAESDTIFDSISNAETKKIARVAMEISSLSEIFKGYLAGANDPKYKYN